MNQATEKKYVTFKFTGHTVYTLHIVISFLSRADNPKLAPRTINLWTSQITFGPPPY